MMRETWQTSVADLVYYVTGHGMGHAVRSATVIRGLVERRRDLRVAVRTAAPERLFAEVCGPRVSVHFSGLDPGAVERDPLAIDAAGTAAAVREAFARREETRAAEAAEVRRLGARLIAADVPFMAGYVAEAAGVPCVAVSNFTWDWVYEPLFRNEPDAGTLLEWLRGGYRRMELLVRLPFGGGEENFRRVRPAGFLPRPCRLGREEARERLGISPRDPRPCVLPAMRGGTARELLERAAADAPEFRFLWLEPEENPPANAVVVPPDLALPEAMQAADVVVAKPGWGILNDCITAGKALLWPPRTGFREDAVSTAGAARYIRLLPLPREDYEAGRWGAGLREVLAQPRPAEGPPCGGVEECVEALSGRL